MENSFLSRLKRSWNVFLNREKVYFEDDYASGSYYYRPDRQRFRATTERTIVSSVYNRIAVDVASIDIRHVRLDENGRFLEEINSGMNNCFKVEANIDQTGREFIQDVVLTMLDEGVAAILPADFDTDVDPEDSSAYDILTMRTGKIVQWYPYHVKVEAYDVRTGHRKQIIVPKTMVAIVTNPFYSIMNEPNSTVQRLMRKLSLLDGIDEQAGSGKLDLIIQLPYVIKSEARREQAEKRRKDIEDQLAGSKYGIAYTDGTEHIVQLNRSLDNNLAKQVEDLTNEFYTEFAITTSILDGTADEKTMTNYYNRVVEPIVNVIVEAMIRVFLTKTARSQKQSIMYFRDPFKLIPISQVAEIADKFTRNEIMSSNEIRQIVGRKPSSDPAADELRNKNLNQSAEELMKRAEDKDIPSQNQNGDKGDKLYAD